MSRTASPTGGGSSRRIPALSALITDAIGDGWTRDLEKLSELEPFAEDDGFCTAFDEVKQGNKRRLAAYLEKTDKISSIRPSCSTARQSAFMNTRGSFSTCSTPSPSTTGCRRPGDGCLYPEDDPLLRQIGAGIPHVQAHHQTDP